jgi:hypothetical protein
MKLQVICGQLLAVLALAGCSSTGSQDSARTIPVPSLPLAVDNGNGSQNGNYAGLASGDMQGPAGEHCVVFTWDRPLTRDLAIRFTSASCESLQAPGRMVSRELSRTVIPIADSTLATQPSQAGY